MSSITGLQGGTGAIHNFYLNNLLTWIPKGINKKKYWPAARRWGIGSGIELKMGVECLKWSIFLT